MKSHENVPSTWNRFCLLQSFGLWLHTLLLLFILRLYTLQACRQGGLLKPPFWHQKILYAACIQVEAHTQIRAWIDHYSKRHSRVVPPASHQQQWSSNWTAWSHTIFLRTHGNLQYIMVVYRHLARIGIVSHVATMALLLSQNGLIINLMESNFLNFLVEHAPRAR